MINTCCCIHKELHKIFKLQGHYDLEAQGQEFSNSSKTFRCLINRSSQKVKFGSGPFLTLKQKFWKFEGNLTLKVKVKVTRFIIHSSILKPNSLSCCIHKELHKIFKLQGQFDLEDQGRFQTHLRHLDTQ